MISLYKLFLEVANVPCEHPSGIVAPFGFIDPSIRNQALLSRAQNFNKLDLDTQAKELNKLRGF
jgi:hypothetical protein